MATRTRYIIGFTVLSVLAALLLPAMPQPVSYHDFADHREMLGVANFLDVASNVAFVLAGLAGFAVVLRPRTEFASNAERWPYAVFFAGMVLTGLGSAYYHLVPDNERLFWDRLPMTIAFMSLIAAQVVDRIDDEDGARAAGADAAGRGGVGPLLAGDGAGGRGQRHALRRAAGILGGDPVPDGAAAALALHAGQ